MYFSRVISNGLQSDVCIGTDEKSSKKFSSSLFDKKEKKTGLAAWTILQDKFNKALDNTIDKRESTKSRMMHNFEPKDCENLNVIENNDVVGPSQDYSLAVDKLTLSHDFLMNTTLNGSLSSW